MLQVEDASSLSGPKALLISTALDCFQVLGSVVNVRTIANGNPSSLSLVSLVQSMSKPSR